MQDSHLLKPPRLLSVLDHFAGGPPLEPSGGRPQAECKRASPLAIGFPGPHCVAINIARLQLALQSAHCETGVAPVTSPQNSNWVACVCRGTLWQRRPGSRASPGGRPTSCQHQPTGETSASPHLQPETRMQPFLCKRHPDAKGCLLHYELQASPHAIAPRFCPEPSHIVRISAD